MPSRQFALFSGLKQELIPFLQQYPDHLWLGDIPTSLQKSVKNSIPYMQAKNLLGQECNLIIYNALQGINLEALAIASGTLKQSGLLLLLLPDAQQRTNIEDQDSLRWSGINTPISTPNFSQHFQGLIEKFAFPQYEKLLTFHLVEESEPAKSITSPTIAQQKLLNKIQNSTAELIILTAKRGRGKSTLLGFLASQWQQKQQPFYLTAPNRNATKSIQAAATLALPFIAPDELSAQLTQNPEAFKQQILVIDEAAMLPLSKLKQFSQHFKQVIFSTTVQSYEGTGRGFILRFVANLSRPFQHFSLHQPLRWKENDVLEQFIDELLLLNAEDKALMPLAPMENQLATVQYVSCNQQELIQQAKLEDFYGLLCFAHYRTSPIDLRRLFDAPSQQFYLAQQQNQLLAGIWAIEEGDIQDSQLIQQIAQGLRRPRGNLVPQALCFHYDLTSACQLRSLRISRIAVHPQWQRQGIGRQLVIELCTQAQQNNMDFVSVSFSYNQELLNFWKNCGFSLLYLGEHLEASSGCYSLIMGKALSSAGQQLIAQGEKLFKRNLALQSHPLSSIFAPTEEIDWRLQDQDFAMLEKFANQHGSLYSCTPALRRLSYHHSYVKLSLIEANSVSLHTQSVGKKTQLKIYRVAVKNILQKLDKIL